MNKDSGIFVTLNLGGKHYGGRSKLHDNLKKLFRPVAISETYNGWIDSWSSIVYRRNKECKNTCRKNNSNIYTL